MLSTTVTEVLENAGQFSDNFKSDLDKILHSGIYQAKQIVHAAGQVETNLYLIERGFARSYYYDRNGNEHTVKFWAAKDLIFSYEGYYKVPSFYYTEFMENTTAIALNYNDLTEFYKQHPEITMVIKYALIKSRSEEYERQHILTMPTHERYQRLMAYNSQIFQKASAKYIASYLNMSRETLARQMGRH